ncbi:bis(5'-nucleosyl)-tetraphosphatase [Tautonia sociabilis]|uniref:Bis(5'-nucleosyl)-tetraphosphatase [asymmetrical] n=1 Tax=Tautonia sociabilis TaxID=2080755 RepID=A0A432MP90_9BACT|nr:NUDIX domain-containing protein [Tautonia sociabilis]RUL88926.1 NUDIX domain-containing protein [Tautonia sociabilis]
MRRIRACGILLMTRSSPRSFLLLRHDDRWDLPKGRVDGDESDLDCALREFEEETGIPRSSIALDPTFRYTEVYSPIRKKTGERDHKTLVIFLATVPDRLEITLTEHLGHEWVEWRPPHDIQANTINPLLAAVADHLSAIDG